MLFGEGSGDEFVPLGVVDLLIEEFVGDPVLVLLDDVWQYLFSLGEAVVRAHGP